MFTRLEFRTGLIAALSAVGVVSLAQPASATLIYATSITTGDIYSVDSSSHVVTQVFNTGVPLDSLFFDPSGRIIFSEIFSGNVSVYNLTTHSTSVLASGLSVPIDLALEPSLTSFLVGDSTSNSLSRVSLSGGVLSTFNLNGRPDGIAYDGNGHLFVNVSSGFQHNDSKVVEIDATTGAVVAQTSNTRVFLDGLTFDSHTGMLFASDYNNGRILEINPNNLSSITTLTPKGSALSDPDGITSDGLGNLFIASRGNATVTQYSITTNIDTALATIKGLDDLAPASGLGAPSIPEPSTFILELTGVTIGLGYYCKERRRG